VKKLVTRARGQTQRQNKSQVDSLIQDMGVERKVGERSIKERAEPEEQKVLIQQVRFDLFLRPWT